jgi:uncharacterized membrane protein YedE/YeeE
MEYLILERWSPYVVGIGIGILSWFAFLLSDKAIGCSTAYARTSGMIERFVRGNKVLEKPYYKKFAPVVDWEWMLVVGVVIGAFISANRGGTFHVLWVPSLWAASFGTNPVLRWLVALIGGILMGLGARWAGGCTSGHGISGTLQLAVSSWLAAICFFIGGIATAMLIFYVIG